MGKPECTLSPILFPQGINNTLSVPYYSHGEARIYWKPHIILEGGRNNKLLSHIVLIGG
jgi:hypothetical protein